MAINWGLLNKGPQFENVLASFEAGKMQRRDTDVRNAIAGYESDPDAAISGVMRADPRQGMQLRQFRQQELAAQKAAQQEADKKAVLGIENPQERLKAALDTGDPGLVNSVMGIDKAQATQLAEKTEMAAKGYYALRKAPPEARAALYAEFKPGFEALGVPDFDPMDDNLLDGRLRQSLTMDKALKLDTPKTAPSGYRFNENDGLEFIPGGPADPATIATTSGVRREAVTSRPMPKTGGGGRGGGGQSQSQPWKMKGAWD